VGEQLPGYGARIHAVETRPPGWWLGRDQVAGWMRATGIDGVRRDKRMHSTKADPATARHPDLGGPRRQRDRVTGLPTARACVRSRRRTGSYRRSYGQRNAIAPHSRPFTPPQPSMPPLRRLMISPIRLCGSRIRRDRGMAQRRGAVHPVLGNSRPSCGGSSTRPTLSNH
jgi:hypothetical protein